MEPTDVCLILEGTYPFVRGGVSSWVHSLIRGLPDVTFSLLAISPSRDTPQAPKYELPKNVRAFCEVFIHELSTGGSGRHRRASEASWRAFADLHAKSGAEKLAAARALLGGDLGADEALFSRRGWELVLERYRTEAPETSFIDYFWTWRAVHAPLFQTIASEIPPARLYHPVSTGYAGLVGALAKLRTGRPLVVTEHGIYVRERLIDIARADWIHEEPVRLRSAQAASNPLKTLWSELFVTLAQATYAEADVIVALFEANEKLQHELGAPPSKTRVIPNGVRVDDFGPLATQRRQHRPRRVGFVGRVVPIKDVKTLLRAFKLVSDRAPDVEFWVVGPTDEDPAYFAEVQELARLLDLSRMRFTGSMDVKKVYPEIDVMVLTSLSEGQPLTILEAACAGVPSVATDVGDCRALCEGRSRADQALGPSGIVTRMGDPADTAEAISRILDSAETRESLSRAGIERTRRFYREGLVLERYRALYAALSSGATLPPAEDDARLRLVPEVA